MLKPTGPLSPFRRDLVMTLSDASEHSGRSISTIRAWCAQHHIGRKVGGAWLVDAVAFDLFIQGRLNALARYLSGDRKHPEIVEAFERLNLPLEPPLPLTRKNAPVGRAAHASA